MARKMSDEKEKEFIELSSFIDFFSTNYLEIEIKNEMHPSNVLLTIIKKHGKSKALQGLKQAVNDSIEQTQHLNLNEIKEIDKALSSNGIITLSILRHRYWSKYKKIITRGKIKGETEYYLIHGVLCGAEGILRENEIMQLNNLVLDFEKNT